MTIQEQIAAEERYIATEKRLLASLDQKQAEILADFAARRRSLMNNIGIAEAQLERKRIKV